jgi:hypothetical protein
MANQLKVWNEGITQTYINDGVHSPEKFRTKWNANYDSNEGAKINIDTLNNHGKKTKVRIGMTPDEVSKLVTMLNAPSVEMPLDKRLHYDFIERQPVIQVKNIGQGRKTRHFRKHASRKGRNSRHRRHRFTYRNRNRNKMK